MKDIQQLTSEFVKGLTAAIEAQVLQLATAALDVPLSRRNGASVAPAAPGARRKMPKQFCPVPYCTNVAAPVFGMVCKKHKDVPKRLIKKYREARRARKAKAA